MTFAPSLKKLGKHQGKQDQDAIATWGNRRTQCNGGLSGGLAPSLEDAGIGRGRAPAATYLLLLPRSRRAGGGSKKRPWEAVLTNSFLGGAGAQGRNRTTDTAIFSRMLYQLSYLGSRAAGHRPCGQADQAGSPPCSSSFAAGIRYWPVSQRPRSTSAQRRLQNGRNSFATGLPQIGQDGSQACRSGI